MVYFVCPTEGEEPLELCGWVTAEIEDDLITSVGSRWAKGMAALQKFSGDKAELGFLRISGDSVVLDAPSCWKGPRPKNLPSKDSCDKAWLQFAAMKEVKLSSSEA